MPSTDWASLTPEQRAAWNRAILRDAEHVGIDPTLAHALCVPGSFATLDGKPIKPGTRMPDGGAMLVVSTPSRSDDDDFLRYCFTATAHPSGEEAARRVAQYVRADLENRYPDSVNARCTHMAGEKTHVGVLAVTWMRGREVFHRRHEVDAGFVFMRGSGRFAGWLLPTIHQQIESTEGAERP